MLKQILFYVLQCYTLEADIHSTVTPGMLSDYSGSRIGKVASRVDLFSILYLFPFWKDSLLKLVNSEWGSYEKNSLLPQGDSMCFILEATNFIGVFSVLFFPLSMKVLPVNEKTKNRPSFHCTKAPYLIYWLLYFFYFFFT